MKSFFKFLHILIGICVVMSGATAHAQDAGSCKALSDAKAYGKKYDNYQYLVPGKDGWFFRTKQDLWSRYEVKRNIPVLQDFVRALKSRGTDLVIAYMPTRGVAAHSKLPTDHPLLKDFDPKAVEEAYNTVIHTLNKNGIRTVGLSDITQGEHYFYKADHHWSRAGAEAMAKALAENIADLDTYKNLPKEKFLLIPDEKTAKIEGSFRPVLESLCGIKPPAQEDQMAHTQSSAANAEALFNDDVFPSVALVGTSNSKKQNNDVHFDDLLQSYLGVEIYNAAISGGGIDDSMLSYLASDAFQKKPAKILIWEIPGYYDLDGEDMRKLLSQATAAARGNCSVQMQAASFMQKLHTENVPLFKNLDPKKLNDPYVVLHFDKPFRKKFSIRTTYTDGKTDAFRFERSKLYPADGIFYYKPPQEKSIEAVDLKIPSNMQGMTLNAQLCTSPIQRAESGNLEDWWKRVRN